MEILTGLFDHMVLQRNRRGVSEGLITGTSTAGGIVKAAVSRRGKVVVGLGNLTIGRCRHGKFSGTLKGLPTGGPYDVRLNIENSGGHILDEAIVRDVLVGDVWLLAGQSNMQGCGRREDRARPHTMVRAFYMTDRWGVAQDPLHEIWAAVDFFHNKGLTTKDPGWGGVGPGVAFGQQLHRLTGVPQGLIACAHGGTSMSQWDPALKKTGGRSLYGAMHRRLVRNGGKVAGMAWYQGCSDANNGAASLYTARMKKLVAAVRRDTGNRALPWVIVQISRVIGNSWNAPAWNFIQDQQRRLPKVIKRLAVVPAIDLSMEDLVHLSGKDQQRLGRRIADAMQTLRFGKDKPQIDLKSMRVVPRGRTADVVLTFSDVRGKLRSDGRPLGFDIMINGHSPYSAVLRTDLDGPRAILHTTLSAASLTGKSVSYGRGLDPACNITDASDRSLPVMGPIEIAAPRGLGPFIKQFRVSPPLPCPDGAASVAYPSDVSSLGLKARVFPYDFCDVHPEIARHGLEERTVYFALTLKCSEPMKLAALIGYDGPFTAWLDGKRIFRDLEGVNPAYPDKAIVRFSAATGQHELLMALNTNHGKAYGLHVRLERLDVTRRQLRQNPSAVAMPQIVPTNT